SDQVAAVAPDGITLIALADGRVVEHLRAPPGVVLAGPIAVDADHRWLAVASASNHIEVWDAVARKDVAGFAARGPINGLWIAPDGQHVLQKIEPESFHTEIVLTDLAGRSIAVVCDPCHVLTATR